MEIIGVGCCSSLGNTKGFYDSVMGEEAQETTYAFNEIGLTNTKFYNGLFSDSLSSSAFSLAKLAIADALSESTINYRNISLVLATGAGDTEVIEKGDGKWDTYDLAYRLSQYFNFHGVFLTVSNACSSSGYAVTLCQQLLNDGHDMVVLCGVEAKSVATQATFKAMMALDPDACRPYHPQRKGTVLGAGAAALIFISLEKKQPKASIYASIVSNSITCDAYHQTAPDPSGNQLKRCINEAIIDFGGGRDAVTYFIPHATGTLLNDSIEEKIFSEAFPNNFLKNKIFLIKKYIGHTSGASMAFSLLLAALLIKFRQDSNEGDTTILVTSSGFGGSNSCIILANPNLDGRL